MYLSEFCCSVFCINACQDPCILYGNDAHRNSSHRDVCFDVIFGPEMLWGCIIVREVPLMKFDLNSLGPCLVLLTAKWLIFRYDMSVQDHLISISGGVTWNLTHIPLNDILLDDLQAGCNGLTHWGRDKMADIFQTTFSSAFSWMKMFEFRLKFHWSLFLRVQLTIFQHWFR